uniref:Uncharacterized protein n=1 Tax=Anguilla anguilla TaxID=7936 RepID=A0A0E9UWQ8_ANGAN
MQIFNLKLIGKKILNR